MLRSFLIIFLTLLFADTHAQKTLPEGIEHKNITITYNIQIAGNKKRSVAETYNGAVKTLYVKDQQVKFRFVSLMRSQTLFYTHHASDTSRVATVVKESGKQRYKYNLALHQWRAFNSKYDGANTVLSEDTITIAGYLCKKAVVTMNDGTKIITNYIPGKRPDVMAAAEPMFAAIPGIVLRYELHHGKKSIEYIAKNISFSNLSNAVFTPPVKGLSTKKFSQGKAVKDEMEDDEEPDDNVTE